MNIVLRYWPFLWVISFVAGACGENRLTQRCRYGPERVIVKGGGSYITSVALAHQAGDLLAAWTDKSGTWVLPIADDGQERGKAQRVGPPSASIDLSTGESGYVIAMLRPGHPIWGGGTAMSRELDCLGCPQGSILTHGRAGCYSKGISIVDTPRGALVAWNDGTPSDLAVMMSHGEGDATEVSSQGTNGCCPVFGRLGGSPVLLWGQYTLSRDRAESAVQLQKLDADGAISGPPRSIADSSVEETWPTLVSSPDGTSGVMYRDEHPDYVTPQGYFLRLDGRGEAISEPLRICRYDGQTRAVLMTTGKVWVNIAVRSWAREWILGLDRFEPDGKRIGAQLHVFADHVKYTDVDAVRIGTKYALLFAEDHPKQRIWFAQVRCR